MSRKYFGTDGIRGRANQHPMTPEIALRVGMSAGRHFTRDKRRHTVIIGKDTRISGYMVESALAAGFTSVGMNVFLCGPLPTPAVASLTRSMRCDLGVMISASHNAFEDNGIKLFGPDGYKLSDEVELQIEAMIDNGVDTDLVAPSDLGRSRRIDDAQGRYIEAAKGTFPKGMSLQGRKIVIDCANGAAYRVAPTVLWELGAEVIPLGVDPNGLNINERCGSTAPEAMCRAVVENGADLGIALDGDADRVVISDEKGQLIDGDQVMAMVGAYWHRSGLLKGGGVVATQMSNLGLERYLEGLGLALIRTKIGDRYVLEHMRAHGFNVGGEQSGHIILSDYATTGDGLVAALQTLAVVAAHDKPLSAVGRSFEPLPQTLRSIRYHGINPLESETVKKCIAQAEAHLVGRGRLLVRKSGTEPKIRVMVEGDDEAFINRIVDDIVEEVERACAHAA
ncbi:MAG: phosphoglucosamine mutase [Rhodospirillaceae bacterium]|mgnify:CR=1 FL=1|nr:phosphoglucosamine mutase [Rhodospirillaceae bacterium]